MSEELKNTGRTVARINKISEGGRVCVERKYSDKGIIVFEGFVEMKLNINDRIRTNETTFSSFEFYTGGQMQINRETVVEITSENEMKLIGEESSFLPRFLGKFRGPAVKPMEVRGSSGIMGGQKG